MNHLIGLRNALLHSRLTKPAYIDSMHEAHQRLYEYADFIERTDIASIEITDGRVVMTTRGPASASSATLSTSELPLLRFSILGT